MPRRPRRAADPDGAGFVLVGVLMFILVLTILGLTLFSLSSFESQFFNGSLAERQAFDAATSAIERAQFVLGRTGKLSDAQKLSGDDPIVGVEYVVAKQGTDYDTADSTGNVNWDPSGSPVWIRALAVVNGRRCLIEARFRPNGKDDTYRRLFTLSAADTGLYVYEYAKDSYPPYVINPVGQQVYLNGGLSQFSADSTFLGKAKVGPTSYSLGDSVPGPDVSAFVALHSTQSGVVPIHGLQYDVYDLDASGSPDQVRFFFTSWTWLDDQLSTPHGAWSLNADDGNGIHRSVGPVDTALITVRGTCIWMFDRGVRFHRAARVEGSGAANDALVIVALPSTTTGSDAGEGILFKKGLIARNASVVLVTSGGVGLQHWNDSRLNSSAPYLSVFAKTSDVVGPEPGYFMTLTHLSNAAQDQTGGLIDRLSQKGYLPNTSASTSGNFTPKSGTWREITSSDGTY